MSERPFKLPRQPSVGSPVELSQERAAELECLLDAGKILEAVAWTEKVGPPRNWAGAEAMAVGSRLLFQAGAERACYLQILRAFRQYPHNPRVMRSWLWYLWRRRCPLRVWEFLQTIELGKYSDEDAAIFWRRRSSSFLDYRDFQSADEANEQAARLTNQDADYYWQKARIRWGEDRLEEALALLREGLALAPRHSDLVYFTAQLLQKMARDAELESLINEAVTWSEDRFLTYVMIGQFAEQKRYEETLPWLERAREWAPWAEPPLEHWRQSRLFDTYYYLSDHERTVAHAEHTGVDFHREVAKRLSQPPPGAQRVQIAVPFIGQEFNTCGPATLVALARFWGRDLDQAQVVKDIWYNGTFDWKERGWGEKQGFAVREFRVTWEAARRLLMAGLPFAMATSGPGWAHLQGVMGFDDWRNSLFVREPSSRIYSEYEQEKWLKQQAWFGPRGLVLAPPERAAELAAIELPDAELYDGCYRLQLALENHQRAEAAECVAGLRAKAPEHNLTLTAERRLAEFDDNGPARMASVRRLRAIYPDSPELALVELNSLRSEGTAQARIALLQNFTTRKDCHALLRMELAEELHNDARTHSRARSELWRAHLGFNNARILRAFANLEWDSGNRERSTRYYRFAFTHEPLVEHHADSYFKALRLVGRAEEGMRLLRERFERQKTASSNAAYTLVNAYELADQRTAALATLDEAIAARPQDVELLLWAAEFASARNLRKEAAAWLAQASAQNQSPAWLRAAARLAVAEGRPAEALEYWRSLAKIAPTNVTAHEEIAGLLNRLEGKPATLAHLRAMAEAFPHHLGLQHLYIRWQRLEDRAQTVQALERILALHTEDGWLRRELANQLAELGRPEEAAAHAREALAREPLNSVSLNIAGFVASCCKDYAGARNYFQTAIRLDANNAYALEKLLALTATREEAENDITFIEGELARQDYPADGVREFADRTWDSDKPERALALIQNALKAAPGVWHHHSTHSNILLRQGRVDEAYAAAKLCTEQFPLYAGSWLLLTYACTARQDPAGRICAAEMAAKLNPDGESIIEELGAAYAAAGRFNEEAKLYEQALGRWPQSATFLSRMAQTQARAGRTAEAITHLKRALEQAPGNGANWSYLEGWGGREACLAEARALSQARPGDAQVWLVLARFLEQASPVEAVAAAVDNACRRDPWNWQTHDQAAQILADRGCYTEALLRSTPAAFPIVPIFLRGRHAWILKAQGKRDEAIALMHQLLALDPTYFWATMELIEWYQEAKIYPEQLALAERAASRWPRSCKTWGWVAQAAINNKQTERAITALKEALKLDPTYTWGWDKLLTLVPAGELENQAREMTRLCPGHPEPWMMLARACDVNRRLDEALAALDEAVARQARFEEAHEYRADLLARASRFQEALAACAPKAFGDKTPLTLRGRAACILWDSGRKDEALAAMQAVLAEHPTYSWGGIRLLDWLNGLKKWADLLAAAQRHQKALPDSGPGYGFAAIAHRELRQFDEAIQDLTTAVAKSPDYQFAITELLRLHLRSLRWQKGREVLETHGAKLSRGQQALFRAELAFGMGDRPAFVTAVKALALTEDWDDSDFSDFQKQLRSMGWLGLYETTLQNALKRAEVSPVMAGICVAMRTSKRNWTLWPIMRKLNSHPKIQQAVATRYLYDLANDNTPSSRILWVLYWYRTIIESNTAAWGNAAACLEHIDRYHSVIKWMENWRDRPDIEMWAVLNLLYAYLGLGRYQDAGKLARELLSKRARQQGTDQVHAVYAFTCILANQTDLAANHRAAVQKNTSDRVIELLNLLTDMMLLASRPQADHGDALRGRLKAWRKMAGTPRKCSHLLQARCCKSALIFIRAKSPGSVQWRDWWSLSLAYLKAFLRKLGFRGM